MLQPAAAQEGAPRSPRRQPAPASSTPRLPAALPASEDFTPGVLLLRFESTRQSAPAASLDALQQAGAAYLDTLDGLPVERWQVPAGRELELAAQFSALPGVRYAEPDYYYSLAGTTVVPDDPAYLQQWAHTSANAESGWDITTGSSENIIAIIDTGINFSHPDFAGKILTNLAWNYVDDNDEANDVIGHGTHVAGIAAAIGNNLTGVAGVDWNARILPLKVCSDPDTCPAAFIAAAVAYACDNNARVINLSMADTAYSDTLQLAINDAYANGCLIVAAAGDDANDVYHYPAAYNNVFAVSATNPEDLLAWYSSYGDYIDITAPGGEQLEYDGDLTPTLTRGILSTYTAPEIYYYLDGTSMAAAYVSGVASLVWALQPGFTPYDVEWWIEYSAADLPLIPDGELDEWDIFYGWGLVDVGAALTLANSLSAPALEAQGNNDLDGNYTMHWLGVTGATHYTLESDDNPAFSSPATAYEGAAAQFAVANQPGGAWYYRVQADNGLIFSEWGNTQRVHVAPAAPVLNAISNPSSSHTYTLSWSSLASATAYLLEEDSDPAFSNPVTRYEGPALSYTFTYQPAGTWHYRLHASSSLGSGAFSAAQSTSVAAHSLEAAEIVPITNNGSGSYTVDWSDVTAATNYELQEASTPYFETPTSVPTSGAISQVEISGKTAGTWYYRVRPYASGGLTGAWSSVRSATVGSRLFLPLTSKSINIVSLPYSQGFEGGVVPPPGWSLQQTSAWTWDIETQSANVDAGVASAAVFYDPLLAAQDEVLLSPYFSAASAQLTFDSAGSRFWCGGVPYNNCDLNIWLVIGEWGDGNDIPLIKGDTAWLSSYVYAPSTILLPMDESRGLPVRLGFEYLGSNGDFIGLDQVQITVP